MIHSIDNWEKGGEHFVFRGHRIFFRKHGQGAKTLLCLHGFPTSSFDYRKIWDSLEREFTVAAPDLIGYGFSAKPPDLDYTTFLQADLVEAFVKHVGAASVDILAHDYGNTVTQELLARANEDGLGFKIDSICFLNGALFPETHRPILAQKAAYKPTRTSIRPVCSG